LLGTPESLSYADLTVAVIQRSSGLLDSGWLKDPVEVMLVCG
jgi:hypothetical protein